MGYMSDFQSKMNSIKLSGKKRKIEIAVLALLCVFVVLCVSVGVAFLAEYSSRNFSADVDFKCDYKNIILMIGDGMGFNHIECAEGYYGEKSYMRSNAIGVSSVITDSKKLFSPTDSAASATALSTGKKTDNGAIARYSGKNITTNAEVAKSLGMAVGIIATEGVSGATPAAFSSHADNRGDSEDIFAGQLESNIDLFVGGKREYYDSLKNRIVESGYSYYNDSTEFDYNKKAWGAYEIKSLPSQEGAGIALADLAEKAIEYLEKRSENGYFLMIEESYIDKRSHGRDIAGMLEKFKSYDLAVQAVVEKVKAAGDTLVIVTADHETGNLTFPGNADFKNPSDKWFKSGGHTRRRVPCFYYSDVGVMPDVIDNTQIAELCRFFIENKLRLK